MNIERQMDSYLEYIRMFRRLSPATDRLYTLYLKRLREFLGSRALSSRELEQGQIIKFLSWMNARSHQLRARPLSPSAQDKAYDVARAFCGWARDNGHQARNPFRGLQPPKVPKKIRAVADKGAVLRLLGSIEARARSAPGACFAGELAFGGRRLQPNPAGARDRVLALRDLTFFATMFYSASRIGETCVLELPDLQMQQAFIVYRHGKGDKWRVVPMHAELRPILARWLKVRAELLARHDIRSQYVFPALPGRGRPRSGEANHVSDHRMQKLLRERYLPDVRERGAARGIPARFTPHALRHSMATRWLSHGAQLGDVQELLGHEDPATTKIYDHMTPARLRRAVARG